MRPRMALVLEGTSMAGEPSHWPTASELDAKVCPTCQRPLDTWQDECPMCREPATLRFSLSTEALPAVPAHLRDALDDETVVDGGETEAVGSADVAGQGATEPGAYKPPVAPFDEELPDPFPSLVGHFVPGGFAGGAGGGGGCGDGGC